MYIYARTYRLVYLIIKKNTEEPLQGYWHRSPVVMRIKEREMERKIRLTRQRKIRVHTRVYAHTHTHAGT